jgi:Alpha/beta hydrolase domain
MVNCASSDGRDRHIFRWARRPTTPSPNGWEDHQLPPSSRLRLIQGQGIVARVLRVLLVLAAMVAVTELPSSIASASVAQRAPAVQITSLGTSGNGVPNESKASQLVATGYVEREYLMSGTGRLFSGSTSTVATPTGQTMPYTTRILVRVPKKASQFSGRVVVEPFNTSGMTDLDAAWDMIGPQLMKNGDAWIGVTVRNSSVAALQSFDPVRYAKISLPSNGLEWDVLTQVAQLVRSSSSQSPLHPLSVKYVYQAGYSQSAVDSVTYADSINPIAKRTGGGYLYNGFLIMGHDASFTPLNSGVLVLPKFEFHAFAKKTTSPIVDVETQTDVLGFQIATYVNPGGASVRRPDSDTPDDQYQLYEIPGASHASGEPGCDGTSTTFPLQYFEQAALMNLYAEVEHGTKPPHGPLMNLDSKGVVSTPVLDENGNATGGIRSPFLDDALARYQSSDTPAGLCTLEGVETPLPSATLQARYHSINDYMKKFTGDLDTTIKNRFLLKSDRAQILAATRTKATHALGTP